MTISRYNERRLTLMPTQKVIAMVSEVDHGSLRVLFTGPPVGVHCEGDIDFGTRPVLTWALALALEGAEGDLRADLHAVDFVDVGGLRVLAKTAFEMAEGHRLIIEGLRPGARRIAELCGWTEIFTINPEKMTSMG